MTVLHVVRHGYSQANLDNIFAGAGTDAPLTEIGRKQAETTAKYLAENVKATKVYASGLCRAYETGQIIADAMNIPIEKCESLREIVAGDWEGVLFDALDAWPEFDVWKNNIGHAACPNGETVAQLQARVVGAVKEIARKHEGETVILASHASPIRVLQCYCQGASLDDMQGMPWVSNASVTTVVYDNDKLTMERVSYDEHLKGMKTALPDNV